MKNLISNLIAQQGILNSGGGGWYVPTIPTVGTLQTTTRSATTPGYFGAQGDKLALVLYGDVGGINVWDFSSGVGVRETVNYSGYPYGQSCCDFTSEGHIIVSSRSQYDTNGMLRSFYNTGPDWQIKVTDTLGMAMEGGTTSVKVNRNDNSLMYSILYGRQTASYSGTAITMGDSYNYGGGHTMTVIDIERDTEKYLIADYNAKIFYIVSTDGSTTTIEVTDSTIAPKLIYPNSAVFTGNSLISINRNGNGIYKYTIGASTIDLDYSTTWSTTPDLPFQIFKADTNLYLALSHGGSGRNGVADWIIDTGTALEVTNDPTLSSAIDIYNLERYFIANHPTGGKFVHAAANNIGTLYSWKLT